MKILSDLQVIITEQNETSLNPQFEWPDNTLNDDNCCCLPFFLLLDDFTVCNYIRSFFSVFNEGNIMSSFISELRLWEACWRQEYLWSS
jgi:hypothetical protein